MWNKLDKIAQYWTELDVNVLTVRDWRSKWARRLFILLFPITSIIWVLVALFWLVSMFCFAILLLVVYFLAEVIYKSFIKSIWTGKKKEENEDY